MLMFAGILVLAAAAAALPHDVNTRDITNDDRYNSDTENVYHLFTRQNPQWSQVIITGSNLILSNTNFDGAKRTVILIHGWRNNVYSDFNNVLVPAYLEAEDVNIIVVDWYAGSGMADYNIAAGNVPIASVGIARFINWISMATGSSFANFHVVGHGIGGHLAGLVGRNLGGVIGYITALDPALDFFEGNEDITFHKDDGIYTEVIHTNVAVTGYIEDLGKVDFYPNGGLNMTGCLTVECDHNRSFHYFAESLRTGGFVGNRCNTFIFALLAICNNPETLNMGGATPKTGQEGVYHLVTNASPPFSLS